MHKLSSQIFFYGQTCAYLQNQWKILLFVNKRWGEVKTSVFILNNIKFIIFGKNNVLSFSYCKKYNTRWIAST